MPCDAIATVTVEVKRPGLLSEATLCGRLLRHHLKEKGAVAVEARRTEPFLLIRADSLWVRVGETQVEVTGGTEEENRRLAQEVGQFLTEVAGLQFQQQMMNLLCTKYAVTSANHTPNRALVLTLKL